MSERSVPADDVVDELRSDHASNDERWALSLISSGHYLSHFYGLVLPPLFPLLKKEFDISYIELGLAITAYSLLGGILQAPVGFLVDRLGPSRVLLSGMALIAASVLLMGFVSSYWMLLVLAIFAGLGNSVFHPADYAILAGSVGEKRLGRAYSMHTFSGFLGGACAPVAMLALAAQWDWRSALIITGGLGLVVFAIMAIRRDVLVGEEKAETNIIEETKSLSGLALLTTAPILLFLVFFILYGIASSGLIAFISSGLMELHGIGLEAANTALTAHLFGVVGGILLTGLIADRYSRHIVTGGAALVLATIATLLPTIGISSEIGLIVVMTLAGIGLGGILPPRDLMLNAVIPRGQTGKVFGFVFVGYSLGYSISPPALGAYLDTGQPEMVFIGCAGFAALSLVAVITANIVAERKS
ncbi:MAG: MFS transporter [Candidatus Latescibacterota bacterium]